MRNYKKILSISLINLCLLALVATSYSWVRRVWAPQFAEESISIETAGSLVINLVGNDAPLSSISLNDLLTRHDFQLKQVSNATGESDDFFTIDYGSGQGQEKLQHINRTTESYTAIGEEYGYVEGTFFLAGIASSLSSNKYVYIDYNSCIDNVGGLINGYNPAEAIRVSITVTKSSIAKTYLIRKTLKVHEGASAAKNPDGTYVVDNQLIYNNVNGAYQVLASNKQTMTVCTDNDKDGKVCTFANFNGGYDSLESLTNDIDTDKILFVLTNDESVQVTIRVWLEGYDVNCVDAIASSKIKLKIIFKSYDFQAAQ